MKKMIAVFVSIFVAVYIWAIGGAVIVLQDIISLNVNDVTGLAIFRIVTWQAVYDIVLYLTYVALDELKAP